MDTPTTTDLTAHYLMNTYRRAPVAFRYGQGCWLTDLEGRRYLDFIAGIAVCALGHNHPALTEAIQTQAARLLHVSNLFLIPEQAVLARRLVQHSGLDRVFFCNSGAEANEAAIKLARKYWHDRETHRFEIIVAERSFHGRTLGTLAATAQPRYQRGFAPLPPGFVVVPFNDLGALRAAVTPATAAIMLEVVQGEGGYRLPSPDYLPAVRRLCDERGVLLILDEIQTGVGRTGRWFAWEHYGARPDIMTLAKGLGSGVPIGALLAREAVAAAFQPGDHGSTFGGNPLACAAALAVVETIERDGLVAHAAEMGAYCVERLQDLARRRPVIAEVRGMGLMVAVDLAVDAAGIVAACRERGLLLNAVQPRTLRLAPPLTVTTAEVDQAVEMLGDVLAAVERPAAT
ncbi:MAG: acetylornithine transaminase [Armatimonadota bacterium]|nr:acetylornithine transaminase [Armatimonadota bacterium]MDR7451252.1 acetylornithine transaminase [Armatimonadota bacterium]MDR7466845.1 acetylornithine transaminase [Armatimonadota bacterium]MDR7492682.1 acetylornithine transaminase [Armatimonadota bacterium]MDR7499611.1 acetylornithine transaminase [Armatimonadota bacterium]